MTEIVIVSKTCNCDPNHKEQWKKRLAIVEGNTTVWMCPHSELFTRRHTESWERTKV